MSKLFKVKYKDSEEVIRADSAKEAAEIYKDTFINSEEDCGITKDDEKYIEEPVAKIGDSKDISIHTVFSDLLQNEISGVLSTEEVLKSLAQEEGTDVLKAINLVLDAKRNNIKVLTSVIDKLYGEKKEVEQEPQEVETKEEVTEDNIEKEIEEAKRFKEEK